MESSRNKILKSNNFYFTVIVLTSKNKTEGQNDEMDGRLLLIPHCYAGGNNYPYRSPPVFSGVRVVQSLVFCIIVK